MIEQQGRIWNWLGVFALASLGLPAVGGALFLWVNSDWIPDSTLAALRSAPKAEVRRLIGNPNHVTPRERSTDHHEQWIYRREPYLAKFQVYLAPDDTVERFEFDR